MVTLAQGAEAIISKKKEMVLKHRLPKLYRHHALDEKLRKHRTRAEARILQKLEKMNFPAPRLHSLDEKKMEIGMTFISGKKLTQALTKKNCNELGKKIGVLLAQLHENHIIHGDLTTSNMILQDHELFVIDFGLSFISKKTEDKAVDLHLLRQALESKHYALWEECFCQVRKGYSAYGQANEVLARLQVVEERGRNKAKF